MKISIEVVAISALISGKGFWFGHASLFRMKITYGLFSPN
jgi:hypothetical protein